MFRFYSIQILNNSVLNDFVKNTKFFVKSSEKVTKVFNSLSLLGGWIELALLHPDSYREGCELAAAVL
jgi:hypothetical protein